MTPQKRKGGITIPLKIIFLVITSLSFLGLLSCTNSGTNSNASSGGTSGTGTDWKITIQVGTNPLPFTGFSTTTILALVKDGTGAPAPNGTNICFGAVLNGFLSKGDTTKLLASVCETTTNNLGQSIQTYQGRLLPGDDTIEITSQGVIAHVIIHNN